MRLLSLRSVIVVVGVPAVLALPITLVLGHVPAPPTSLIRPLAAESGRDFDDHQAQLASRVPPPAPTPAATAVGAAGPTAVAASVAVGGGTRLASWAWWSSKSRLDPAASARARLVEVAGTRPSTRLMGTASTAAAPTTTMTVRRIGNLMTRLTRSA